MKANGGAPAMDVLDLLGNQLVMDPETLAMLKQEGKVSESEFAALLETIGQNEAQAETLFGNKEIKVETQIPAELKAGNENNLKLLNPTELPKVQESGTTPKVPNPLGDILAKQPTQNIEAKAEVVKVVPQMSEAKIAVEAEAKNPNLVKLSQFLEKQTVSTQKRFQNAGQYEAAPKSMFIEKVEATNSLAKTGAVNAAKAVTLQDLMFAGSDETNLESGEKNQAQQLLSPVKANTISNTTESSKIFNLDQVIGDKSLSSEALISKIQDHILQTRVGNEKNVEMSFHHKELGQVGLHVQKHAGDSIGITITTASVEGAKFFNQNQGELLQSLSTAGIQVGDFKLDTSKSSSQQDSSGDSSKQFAGNNKQQSQSESGQRKHEQDKRQSLWEQFQEQAAA